jgi:hypothetical protein
MKFLKTVLFLAFSCGSAWADYAWIPDYLKMPTRVGFDYFTSDSNFATDGSVVPLSANDSDATLTQYRFWVDPELGVTPEWSLGLHLTYISSSFNSVEDGTPLLSGSGIGDIYARLKWAAISTPLLLTPEIMAKIPTTSVGKVAAGQLVIGDGNFDVGLTLHLGQHQGFFRFDLSPGLLIRSGGYSSAGTVYGSIELNITRGYLRAFGNLLYSFGNSLLYDSSLDTHDALGTGGSYALLSGSPSGFNIGGKIGITIVEGYALEATLTRSLAGTRFPDFTQVGGDLLITFDFLERAKKTKKLREIPLDSDAPKP